MTTPEPHAPRFLHKMYARAAGYFWLPCPLCGEDFGGHEWRDIDGKPSSVPDPTEPPPGPTGPWMSVGICPTCTRAGRGWIAASAVADAHPWQEYNAHGNTCQYPGCRMTEVEHEETP